MQATTKSLINITPALFCKIHFQKQEIALGTYTIF